MLALSEALAHLRQCSIESRVDLIHVTADRGVGDPRLCGGGLGAHERVLPLSATALLVISRATSAKLARTSATSSSISLCAIVSGGAMRIKSPLWPSAWPVLGHTTTPWRRQASTRCST